MANLHLKDFRVLSFDVYGTLVDWENGILQALQPLLTANGVTASPEEVLSALGKVEKEQQRETPEMQYTELLGKILVRLFPELGLSVKPTPEQCRAFGESVGSWPAFPDTVDALRRLGKHYKLVVLSNVDRTSFAATNAGPLEGVRFDAILTAQDIGSYKPDKRNFDYMLSKVQESFGVGKEGVLQTAQSQFHDHHPAQKYGIRSVWINRQGAIMGQVEEPIYNWKFETLGQMADALEAELAAAS